MYNTISSKTSCSFSTGSTTYSREGNFTLLFSLPIPTHCSCSTAEKSTSQTWHSEFHMQPLDPVTHKCTLFWHPNIMYWDTVCPSQFRGQILVLRRKSESNACRSLQCHISTPVTKIQLPQKAERSPGCTTFGCTTFHKRPYDLKPEDSQCSLW